MPKVSVIIPVYNAENYLTRCLDSVCNQTLEDIEIICVNDCSPDNSLIILQDYAQRDPRIKIINREQNGGESAARNTGIEAATGEYIAFLDNDDAIDKDFYEKLYTKGIAENADISKGEFYTIEYNKTKVFDTSNTQIRRYNSKLRFSDYWWQAIYKKKLIDKFKLHLTEGCPLGADLLFTNQAVLAANKIALTDNTYYQYYHREDSGNSKILPDVKIDSVLNMIDQVSKETNQFGGDDIEGINYINHWALRSVLHYISRNRNKAVQERCINFAEILWKRYIDYNLMHHPLGFEREKNVLQEDAFNVAEIFVNKKDSNYIKLLDIVKQIKQYTRVQKDKKIKVLFDAKILRAGLEKADSKRGIYWVSYNLLKQFMKDENIEVTLFLDLSFHMDFYKKIELLKNLNIICANYQLGPMGKMKIIPNPKFKASDYDVYFNPAHISSLIHSNSFYMLYDAMPMFDNGWFPHAFKDVFYKFHHDLSPSTYYFADSENSKKDFLKYFDNMREDHIVVTPISSSQEFKVLNNLEQLKTVFEKYETGLKPDAKYIFYMGAVDDRRKNLVGSVKYFMDFIEQNNITDLYFLLGGNGQEKLVEVLQRYLGSKYTKYAQYIIPLGFVDEEDVNILYSHSLFFTFLSLYEGFGMPPLEAMMAGTPVICANNSSLPEVVGDAALLVDEQNEEQVLEAFKVFYYDAEKRREYIEKGLAQAQKFSWQKTYEIVSAKIIEILKGDVK